jgi:predicted RNA-binding Zn-ribbon protein involved in translation (DUF1610 family)
MVNIRENVKESPCPNCGEKKLTNDLTSYQLLDRDAFSKHQTVNKSIPVTLVRCSHCRYLMLFG